MIVAAVVAVALATSPVAAGAAKAQRVRVDADVVRYNYPKGEITLTGTPNVKLVRGDATLTCRNVVAKTGPGGAIQTAVCTGDVRLVRGERTVTCDSATFDDVAGRVVCLGTPVVLRDASTEARGTRLVYELDTDQVSLERATIEVPGTEIEQREQQLEQRRKDRGARK